MTHQLEGLDLRVLGMIMIFLYFSNMFICLYVYLFLYNYAYLPLKLLAFCIFWHVRVGGALIPGVGFCWAMNWLSNFGVTLSFPVLAKAEGSPIKTDVLISYLKGFRSTFRFCLVGSM